MGAIPAPLVGRSYRVMHVSGERLGSSNPFKLLADGVPGARGGMGLHTLIVAGMEVEGRPGFVILGREVIRETGDRGNGTELLDRACNVASTVASGTRPSSNSAVISQSDTAPSMG